MALVEAAAEFAARGAWRRAARSSPRCCRAAPRPRCSPRSSATSPDQARQAAGEPRRFGGALSAGDRLQEPASRRLSARLRSKSESRRAATVRSRTSVARATPVASCSSRLSSRTSRALSGRPCSSVQTSVACRVWSRAAVLRHLALRSMRSRAFGGLCAARTLDPLARFGLDAVAMAGAEAIRRCRRLRSASVCSASCAQDLGRRQRRGARIVGLDGLLAGLRGGRLGIASARVAVVSGTLRRGGGIAAASVAVRRRPWPACLPHALRPAGGLGAQRAAVGLSFFRSATCLRAAVAAAAVARQRLRASSICGRRASAAL